MWQNNSLTQRESEIVVEELRKTEEGKGKRQKYRIWTPAQRAEIGKHAAQHGNITTVRLLGLKYPGLKRQTVSDFKLAYSPLPQCRGGGGVKQQILEKISSISINYDPPPPLPPPQRKERKKMTTTVTSLVVTKQKEYIMFSKLKYKQSFSDTVHVTTSVILFKKFKSVSFIVRFPHICTGYSTTCHNVSIKILTIKYLTPPPPPPNLQ